RSLLPDGTVKTTKTKAGERTFGMLPALHRALKAWREKSVCTEPGDYVIATHDGQPVAERNLRRALEQAKERAGIEEGDDERLSWHSLRHSCGSYLTTELGLPPTTVAKIMGHTDPAFTMRVYARDVRDGQAAVADLLNRAAEAGVGQ